MAAVQSKVTAYRRVKKESLDGASDLLDGDREIKRRLITRRKMMTRLSKEYVKVQWTNNSKFSVLVP